LRGPECPRDRTKVKTIRSRSSVPTVTQILIAINVIVFFAETATGAPLGGGGGEGPPVSNDVIGQLDTRLRRDEVAQRRHAGQQRALGHRLAVEVEDIGDQIDGGGPGLA